MYVERFLPSDITSSPSLLTFKQQLKMHSFRRSYPGLTLKLFLPSVVLEVAICCLDHVKSKIDLLIDPRRFSLFHPYVGTGNARSENHSDRAKNVPSNCQARKMDWDCICFPWRWAKIKWKVNFSYNYFSSCAKSVANIELTLMCLRVMHTAHNGEVQCGDKDLVGLFLLIGIKYAMCNTWFY